MFAVRARNRRRSEEKEAHVTDELGEGPSANSSTAHIIGRQRKNHDHQHGISKVTQNSDDEKGGKYKLGVAPGLSERARGKQALSTAQCESLAMHLMNEEKERILSELRAQRLEIDAEHDQTNTKAQFNVQLNKTPENGECNASVASVSVHERLQSDPLEDITIKCATLQSMDSPSVISELPPRPRPAPIAFIDVEDQSSREVTAHARNKVTAPTAIDV